MITENLIAKYRPYNFSDIIGQEKALAPIIRCIKEGNLRNRLFLFGESGVGKTSTAICIARAINCKNYDLTNLKLCGKCYSCTSSLFKTFAFDIISCGEAPLDAKKLKQLRSDLGTNTLYGKVRTIFLDEFHKWDKEKNQDQLNSVLDFMPSGALLICATYRPDNVSKVLRTRFLPIQMSSPTTDEIVKLLYKISLSEGRKISNDRLRTLAFNSNSNPREAINLLENYFMKVPSQK